MLNSVIIFSMRTRLEHRKVTNSEKTPGGIILKRDYFLLLTHKEKSVCGIFSTPVCRNIFTNCPR